MCPEAKNDTRRKKKTGKQFKGWQFPLPLSDEEEEADVEHPISNENNQMDKDLEVQVTNPQ